LHQASSDQQAGERERQAFNQGGIPTLCHAVAKYQQTVEKAIKAVLTALREAGFANWRVGRGHEVTPYMSMLFRLPRKEENKSVLQELGKLLDGNTRRAIKTLETLGPKWPAQGQIPLRNTEYPFEDGKGGWSYPAAAGVFWPLRSRSSEGWPAVSSGGSIASSKRSAACENDNRNRSCKHTSAAGEVEKLDFLEEYYLASAR
jgi:hypothetical protein